MPVMIVIADQYDSLKSIMYPTFQSNPNSIPTYGMSSFTKACFFHSDELQPFLGPEKITPIDGLNKETMHYCWQSVKGRTLSDISVFAVMEAYEQRFGYQIQGMVIEPLFFDKIYLLQAPEHVYLERFEIPKLPPRQPNPHVEVPGRPLKRDGKAYFETGDEFIETQIVDAPTTSGTQQTSERMQIDSQPQRYRSSRSPARYNDDDDDKDLETAV